MHHAGTWGALMIANQTRPVKIFYCCALKDRALLDQLDSHLEVMKRQGKITTWSYRDIEPGKSRKHEVNKHLDTSDIILLLITPDFLHSDLCDEEMHHAFARQLLGLVHVIPIILRPSGWENTPIGELHVLPIGGKPVTTWRDRDEAFQDVARGVSKVVTSLLEAFLEENINHLLSLDRTDEALAIVEEAIRCNCFC